MSGGVLCCCFGSCLTQPGEGCKAAPVVNLLVEQIE